MSSDNTLESLAAETDGSNLYGSIDKLNVHGLNLTVPEDAQAIIKPWDERNDTSRYAESGVDDQFIVHVPFTQNVRVKSVLVKLGRGEVAPRRMRIYANQATIVDFAAAEDITPHLNISLLQDETGVTEYPLRSAAFANVYSLSLFFSESVGGDSSTVYYLGFRGDNRSQRRDASQKLVIPAETAARAPLVDKVSQKTGAQQPTAR